MGETKFREGDVVRHTSGVEGKLKDFDGRYWVVYGHPWHWSPASCALLRRPVRVGDVVRHEAKDTYRITEDLKQYGSDDGWLCVNERTGAGGVVLVCHLRKFDHADGTPIDPPTVTRAVSVKPGATYEIEVGRGGGGVTTFQGPVSGTTPTTEHKIASDELRDVIRDAVEEGARLGALERAIWLTDPDVRALIAERSDARIVVRTVAERTMVLEGKPRPTTTTYTIEQNYERIARAEAVAWKIDDRGLRTRAEKRAREIVKAMRGER